MKLDPHTSDALYTQIGEELARNERSPGAAARAVATAKGNKALAESLYIKCRFEELSRELERNHQAKELEAAQKAAQRAAAAEEQNKEKNKKGIYTCPNCGFRGKLIKKDRGNILVFLALLIFYVIPGVIYAALFLGEKGICPQCGTVVKERM